MSKLEPNPKFSTLASEQSLATAVTALQANGIAALVVSDGAAAKAEVLQRIPPDSQVFTMSSETLRVTGIAKEIDESGRYESVRHQLNAMGQQPSRAKRALGAAPDWTVGSVHAVTEDGHLFIASNTGSQLGAYAYGAGRVLWVVGAQKVVTNDAEAFQRVREYSYPLENERARRAYGIDSGISKLLIINREKQPGRLAVILVKERLGF